MIKGTILRLELLRVDKVYKVIIHRAGSSSILKVPLSPPIQES